MKKIFVILSVLIIFIGISAFVYFQYLSPESRAKSVAESYMEALLSNNDAAATSLYSSQKVDGEISQRNYRLADLAVENATYYLLYNFADDKKPSSIRIGVEDASIKSVKTGSQLGATPSKDKPEMNNQMLDESRCLAKSDLADIASSSVYARNIRGATMIFQENSTNYISDRDGTILLDKIADFYKKSNQKDFILELSGYKQNEGLTEVDSAKIDSLFQRRAVILQGQLTSRGVPLDRVVISEKYTYYIPEQSTAVSNELYVNIDIVNRCIKE